LNKEQDKAILKKIHRENNILFPKEVRAIRTKNGFWLDTDFNQNSKKVESEQILIPF